MIIHVGLQRDAENVLSRKISELDQELQRTRGRLTGMQRDLEKTSRSEQEATNLRNRIKNLEGMEDQLQTVQNTLRVCYKNEVHDTRLIRCHIISTDKNLV